MAATNVNFVWQKTKLKKKLPFFVIETIHLVTISNTKGTHGNWTPCIKYDRMIMENSLLKQVVFKNKTRKKSSINGGGGCSI